MEFKNIKYKIKEQFSYTKGYIYNVFFKLILLFLINFILFGLYLRNFFKINLIILLIFLIIDLYLIRKLLYKKARITKILVISIFLILSFLVAQNYSNYVFETFGLNSFINGFNEDLSDKLILGETKGMLKSTIDSGKEVIETTTNSATHTKEDSKKAFDYINQLRKQNGVSEISWDDKIYELAKYKVDDMNERNYFDHPDPDGKCAGSYAKNFGLDYSPSSFADNLFGYSSPTWFDQKEAVDVWMGSRGHKYNLLFDGHIRGALACNLQYCTFIGQGGSGWVCDTGEAGLAFWDNVGKQTGEI